MSTISGISSGSSSAWSGVDATTTTRRDRMFAKADRNGDGKVDSAELQGMLDKMAQKTGATAANADDVLKTMDTDGNGTLDATELDAGMKSLQPAASSTVDFAQRRGGEGEVHGHDGPPPPDSQGDATTQDTSASGSADGLQSLLANLFQAADTDGNGSLDTSELDTLRTNFDTAIQSLVGGADTSSSAATAASTAAATSTSAYTSAYTSASSGSTTATGNDSRTTDSSSTDGSSSSSTAARDPMAALTALAELVLKEYAATAASSTAAQTTSAAVNLSA